MFDRLVTDYERWAWARRPDLAPQITTAINQNWRRPIQSRPSMLQGLGEDWTSGDITEISGPDWSTFTPADGSSFDSGFDSSTFDAGTMTITAGGGGDQGGYAIDTTPWGGFFTALPTYGMDDSPVTPVDFSAIASAFSNMTPPPGVISSIWNAAKKTATALAKGASAGVGGGGASAGGSAVAQPKPTAAPKQASILPFVLIGMGVLVLADLFSN